MPISSVEFHENFIPKPLDWKAACPPFAIIFGWALERGLLTDWVSKETLYSELYKKLNAHEIDISEFVMKALDGCLTKDLFINRIGEFIEEYLLTGILDIDLVDFFNIKHVYKIPQDWEQCKEFFTVLDRRLEEEND